MSKSTTQKLNELAEYYKVVRGSMSGDQWRTAVKHASGWPDDSIEVIYDRWKGATSGTVTTVPVQEVLVAGNTTAAETTASEAATTSAVLPVGTVVHVHTSPAAATAQVPKDYVIQRHGFWVGAAPQVALWTQTLMLGFLVGVLASKPILRVMGH